MRKMIISERPNNPAYFDKMSDLLNHLLQEQKDGKIQYKELIKKLIEKLKEARSTIKTKYPATIDTKGKYNEKNKIFKISNRRTCCFDRHVECKCCQRSNRVA